MTNTKFEKLNEKYEVHNKTITNTKEEIQNLKNSHKKEYQLLLKKYFLYFWKRISLKLTNKRYLNEIEKKKRFTLTMVGESWIKQLLNKGIQVLFLLIMLFIVIFPFYWMIMTSFKPYSDMDPTLKETFWPKHWSTEAYQSLFKYVDASGATKKLSIGVLFGNSIYIALVSMLAEVLISLLGGFALYNWKTKFNKVFMMFMFALIMIPEEAMLLGRFIFSINLGWKDNVLSLIVPFIGNVYTIYLISNAFSSISPDLKKAAKVDGLSTFKYFWKIAVPAIKSTIVTTMIISFITAYNSTLWPVMIMKDGSQYSTMPMLLYGLMNITGTDISLDYAAIENPFNFKMAASVISIIPIIAMFIIFNKWIVKGMTNKNTNSGVKG